MENKKYLTEENYERGKKKIKTIALVILVVGLLIGGSLIATGLMKQGKINSQKNRGYGSFMKVCRLPTRWR